MVKVEVVGNTETEYGNFLGLFFDYFSIASVYLGSSITKVQKCL